MMYRGSHVYYEQIDALMQCVVLIVLHIQLYAELLMKQQLVWELLVLEKKLVLVSIFCFSDSHIFYWIFSDSWVSMFHGIVVIISLACCTMAEIRDETQDIYIIYSPSSSDNFT